jgi:hypothetical protein
MSSTQHERNLARLLQTLVIKGSEVNSSYAFDDFRNLYHEALRLLEEYAANKNSRFIKEKLAEFPDIRNREYTTSWISSEGIIGALFSMMGLVRGLHAQHELSNDITTISGICDSIIAVLTTPGLEELYYARK